MDKLGATYVPSSSLQRRPRPMSPGGESHTSPLSPQEHGAFSLRRVKHLPQAEGGETCPLSIVPCWDLHAQQGDQRGCRLGLGWLNHVNWCAGAQASELAHAVLQQKKLVLHPPRAPCCLTGFLFLCSAQTRCVSE